MADQFVDVGDLRFRCRIEGTGEWMVLLHGVGGRLDQWDGFVETLGGRYRTMRFDQRGRGESSKPPGPYTMQQFVEDCDAVMTALGIDRAHVVGYSLGAMVAQAYALAHQDRVKGLVLLAGVAGRTDEERTKVLARLDVLNRKIPGEHFENSVGRYFTDAFREMHHEIVAAYAALNRLNDPDGYAAAYHVLTNDDLIDSLHKIRAPTLIATGEFDQGSNPRMSRTMHEKIAGSEMVIFPKLKHAILTEAPALVAETVEPFLHKVDRTTS